MLRIDGLRRLQEQCVQDQYEQPVDGKYHVLSKIIHIKKNLNTDFSQKNIQKANILSIRAFVCLNSFHCFLLLSVSQLEEFESDQYDCTL